MNKEELFKEIHLVYNSSEYRDWCCAHHFIPFKTTSLMAYLKSKGGNYE